MSEKTNFYHCWSHVLNLVVQDIVRLVPSCGKVFDTLQKLYVFIEGSPKRHGEYMSLLSELDLGDDGPCVLQSLSATRWSSRCVNLRTVHRCLPAINAFLETQSSSDARGLFAATKNVQFLFAVEFLKELFASINATSEALQASDTDLAAAAGATASLKKIIDTMRADASGTFDRLYDASGIDAVIKEKHANKRSRSVSSSLKKCVLDRFLTKASDGVATSDHTTRIKQELKLDLFVPVLDAVMVALDSRFNSECLAVIESISSIVTFSFDDKFLKFVSFSHSRCSFVFG